MFSTFTTVSVITKTNPSLHFDAKFPTAYYIFKISTVSLIVVLIVSFIIHSFYIFRQWHLVINRNKFFYLFSTYFIIFQVFVVLSSHFQSYDNNGLKLLFILAMYNFYILVLQNMWRITPKGFDEAKNIFDIKRPGMIDFKNSPDLGARDNELDYFKDSVKVQIVSEAERKTDESFDASKESEDDTRSVQNVKIIRKNKKEEIAEKNLRLNFKIKNRLSSFNQ